MSDVDNNQKISEILNEISECREDERNSQNQISDTTEVVHSEIMSDGKVKVYIEKAVYDGFHNNC